MRRITIIALSALAALLAAGVAGGTTADTRINLVAYSTPRDAFTKIIPAFQDTKAGADTSFSQSYGGSGEQARAIVSGLKADVVDLSLQPDMGDLVQAGIVDRNWNANRYKGFVTQSVVVFVLRDGNPKKIKTWDDLLKKDVEVITPNPVTSGGARWNVMAAYGAQLEQGKSDAEGVKYLETLLNKVPVQDKSARESLQTFQGGKGDVLLAYENEAILAKKKGLDVDYVIPDQTLLIQN